MLWVLNVCTTGHNTWQAVCILSYTSQYLNKLCSLFLYSKTQLDCERWWWWWWWKGTWLWFQVISFFISCWERKIISVQYDPMYVYQIGKKLYNIHVVNCSNCSYLIAHKQSKLIPHKLMQCLLQAWSTTIQK